jgi:hypothetical protein
MVLWKDVREKYPEMPIYFGDYGVRGPNTNQGVPNPHTNGKIRYTIENQYFIARGQPMTKPPKGQQHWALAEAIIGSGYFLGPDFSWGDNEIQRCSNREFPGGKAQCCCPLGGLVIGCPLAMKYWFSIVYRILPLVCGLGTP